MDNRLIGVIGQVLVGDALTNLLVPREHMMLWQEGMPDGTWKKMVRNAADTPKVIQTAALLEGAIGVLMIYHAVRDAPKA